MILESDFFGPLGTTIIMNMLDLPLTQDVSGPGGDCYWEGEHHKCNVYGLRYWSPKMNNWKTRRPKKTVLPNFFCCHGCHGSNVFVWGFAVKHPTSPVSLWFVRVGTSRADRSSPY